MTSKQIIKVTIDAGEIGDLIKRKANTEGVASAYCKVLDVRLDPQNREIIVELLDE